MKVPSNAIEMTCFHTWMGEDNIVRTKIKKGAEVSLQCARENTNLVNSFYKGKKFPLLIDATDIKSISREARNQFSSKNRETYVKAYGIIVSSLISRVIANFFMNINKPTIPTKLFENEQEAEKWLKPYAQ